MTSHARTVVLAFAAIQILACSSGSTLRAANCEPSEIPSIAGTVDGTSWAAGLDVEGLIGVTIAGEDMGAMEPGEGQAWYHATLDGVTLISGGLPDRTTLAVGILEDGSEFALCPFGDAGLTAAAGAFSRDTPLIDLELRRGGTTFAIGHVAEAKALSGDVPAFAFLATEPGVVAGDFGVVRSPGSEISFP